MASFDKYNSKLYDRRVAGEAYFFTPIVEFSSVVDSLNDKEKKELFDFTFTKSRIEEFIYSEFQIYKCELGGRVRLDKSDFLSLNKIEIGIFKEAVNKLCAINCKEYFFKKLVFLSFNREYIGWIIEAIFDQNYFHKELTKIIRSLIKKDDMYHLRFVCQIFRQYNHFLILS